MNSETLQIGDKIQIDKFLYRHVGIYIGHSPDGRCVIHNDKVTGVVTLCSLAEFSDGNRITIANRVVGDFLQRQAVVDRALAYLGTKYDLVGFNCEHFVSLVQTGKAESPQLTGALILGAAALVLMACSRSRS